MEFSVGTTIRPTLFMVIVFKEDYNLLLGHECIPRIGAVPSNLHQMISIWRPNGIVENIEAYYKYFMAKVNVVSKKNFNQNLAKIPPCYPAESNFPLTRMLCTF